MRNVALAPGRHQIGPDAASLHVKTYREGLAAKAGHDLTIEVADWGATVEVADDPAGSSFALDADARSLQVREGVGGAKPLSDKDRADIRKTIDDKILHGQPISFRSDAARSVDGGISVEGALTLAGQTRPVTAQLQVGAQGRLTATIPLTQSAWGIKPYRGMMGALKVRDELAILVDAKLPAG